MTKLSLIFIIITLNLFLGKLCFSKSNISVIRKEINTSTGHFSGRVSRVNFQASLIRIKISFNNIKYLNKKDKVEFWQESSPNVKCKGYVLGKAPDYLLIKVPSLSSCGNYLNLTTGFYMKFFSRDLANNILMGKELMKVILKKRLALRGILGVKQRELDRHVEKVHTVNNRYQLIRDKLEEEWRKEISALEEDRIYTLANYKRTQTDLDEINHKLERYKISDDNLEMDRWSLDPRFYYKK